MVNKLYERWFPNDSVPQFCDISSHNVNQNLILEIRVVFLGKTRFCWAFAIASMLRLSLILFIKILPPTSRTQAALEKLEKNEFHNRIRNELIMLPIPKAKFFDHKVPIGSSNLKKRQIESEIMQKQGHHVYLALQRVSLCLLTPYILGF